MIPKQYDPETAESKYDYWMESGVYEFKDSGAKKYIIDTPPPYPTGNFHVGNALNWCYIDFVARYKRMAGYDVMFPQGWDCHGLPTEVKVEETRDITKSMVSRKKFREYCMELTRENIGKMKQTMKDLGFSIDWNQEYITMDPEYWGNTQRSFLEMAENDYVYKSEHPVNWCPRCETAIAYAEVEHVDRETQLNYLKFPLKQKEKPLEIATTRPELLPSCVAVAVHPKDERYSELIGLTTTVPIFRNEVEIIADENVDKEFGSGAVMICTFGDKQDVRWWMKHDLPLIKGIDQKGRLTEAADEFKGMDVKKGRKAITKKLDQENILIKKEKLKQSVGVCWRCDTPIEILSENQWFVKVKQEKIKEKAREINWIPQHMYLRLEDWVEKMEWDWCVSRQRIFGTPIPAWYCQNCNETILADKDEVPINPIETKPKQTCDCENPDLKPEEDVLDTWMDSSISNLQIIGWPNQKHKNYHPTQLRPQGHDIIRTWAFYTILRSEALTNQKPWDDILINGMVFGEDGNKMSKSLGNIVAPEEVIEKESADAFRLWAAIGGAPGNDIQFRWKDVKASSRFLRKTWNVLRFTLLNLNADNHDTKPTNLRLTDKWIIHKLNNTIETVTEHMNNYQFNKAVEKTREFLWNDLADQYLEMVKWRLYSEKDYAAEYTMYHSINTVIKMLAPFAPFFTEEAYQQYQQTTIHNTQYPTPLEIELDSKIEKQGETLKEIISTIRRYKSENGIPLNEEIDRIEIYNSPKYIENNKKDISNTVWAKELYITQKQPQFNKKLVEIKPDMSIIGPKFKDKAPEITQTIKQKPPQKINNKIENGYLKLDINGETIEIKEEALEFIKTPTSEGKEIDILEIDNMTIALTKNTKTN
ncbi:Valyl-tRNA synthetase [Methanonatronarchaeum thermophilum]|uniref:Valine--tRNA ligase n=1 Tax=Methanonatronarchaeum thermophilum TaxID=1927129 RepID=A0A1Y3GBG1_9EURY|nr:valine--tRNA ligase [Methanonatronarchaeum thermophilum]OUJ18801.1 Valyl-tRNA synthetase [Methanonatronarchaeum thermophilum]